MRADEIRAALGLPRMEAGEYSPLALAYLGDCVYELSVRIMVMSQGNRQVNKLNAAGSGWAKAPTQAKMIQLLMDGLSEEEQQVYRRGRNAKSATPAKHATLSEYSKATGFEALLGWLYLNGREERILELLQKGISAVRSEEGRGKFHEL